MNPILSIIIPIKDIEIEKFTLLIHSVKLISLNHKVEVIIVYSDEPSLKLISNNGLLFDFVKCFNLKPNGIYNAFNFGLSKTTGDWIMFFGGDDLILPSLNNLLYEIKAYHKPYAVIVCKVVFGQNKIYSPVKNKLGLIFRNWCQQGVLYNKVVFNKYTFDEQYPILADHKFNIQIFSDKEFKIKFTTSVISYFNLTGVSQNRVDIKFRRDMAKIISENFGNLYGFLTYFKIRLGNRLKKLPY
jgi:glycosyltransferase involved in cell wall biosynthesis